MGAQAAAVAVASGWLKHGVLLLGLCCLCMSGLGHCIANSACGPILLADTRWLGTLCVALMRAWVLHGIAVGSLDSLLLQRPWLLHVWWLQQQWTFCHCSPFRCSSVTSLVLKR